MSGHLDVVQVAGYYPPHIGGIEHCCRNLSTELVRRGNRVRVLTSTVGSRPAGTRSEDGVEVSYLRGVEFAHTPFAPGLLGALLRVRRGQVVHLHLSHVFTEVVVLLVSWLRGLRYVGHFHMDVDVSGPLGFVFLAYKRTVLPFVLRRAAAVVTLSDEQADLVVERYRVRREAVVVIPNGVTDDHFWTRPVGPSSTAPRGVQRADAPVGGRRPQLLFVGRLVPQKNLPRLLRALPLMRHDVELTVVGDGERAEQVRAVVAELGLQERVHLLGARGGEELRGLYRSADVFVMPSEREGMPLVLLEAMASGLPVVGSAVQGLREFLGGGRGVLVDDPSPQAFAAALDVLLDDPEHAAKLGALGQEWARDYSWSALSARFEGVYRAVLAGAPVSPGEAARG